MTRGKLRVALLALLALALAAGVALVTAYRELGRPYAGWSGTHVDVELVPGLDAGTMLERLAQAGVVREPRLARTWLSWSGGSGSLQAGEYRFDKPASVREVLQRLRDGDVLLQPVTLPEGLLLEESARRLADADLGTYDAFVAAFKDPTPIRELDPQAEDLEGYLFPDTYSFSRGTSPAKIAAALVERFREMGGANYAAQARQVGLTVREAVTLASLIEKETGVPSERRRISRVFHNRLARGMKLHCDPTVRYALQRAARPAERLTYQHLEFDSPWNTYVYAGLPPGPIASPGRESLRAAVAPEAGSELYFVAAPGGGHQFSNDFGAHQRAVETWRSYLRSSR